MLLSSAFQRLYLLILLIATGIVVFNSDVSFSSSALRWDGPYYFACVNWSPDGKLIAVCQRENITLYTDNLELAFTLKGHSKSVESLSWKPDSKMLASGSNDTTIRIWEVQTRKTVNIFRGHSGEITNVRWSPEGTLIASTNTFGPTADFLIFEPLSTAYKYKLPSDYKHPDHDNTFLNTIAWSPTGEQIAVARQYFGVGIWNIKTQKVTLEIANEYIVNDIAWSPDGNKIAVVGGDVGSPGHSSIWNATTGKLLLKLEGHTTWVFSVAWSPDGTYLATSSGDQTIKIWNTSNGKLVEDLSFTRANTLKDELLSSE